MSSFRTRDGLELRYETRGTGPLLVCHPGGPGRAAVYLEDLGGLGRTRTLLMLDPRGCGESDAPEDLSGYAYARSVEDLEDLRLHLGVDRMDLLGHSAGGFIASAYAIAHPDRLRRLVLVTSLLELSPADVAGRDAIRAGRADEPWYAVATAALDALESSGDALPASYREQLSAVGRPFYYGRWDERATAHAGATPAQVNPDVAAHFGGPFGDNWEAHPHARALGDVGVPALAVAGGVDGLTPPSCSVALVAALPDAELAVLDGSGHYPWVDRPELFRACVERFLAGANRPD